MAFVEVALKFVRDVIDPFQSGISQHLTYPSIGKSTKRMEIAQKKLHQLETQAGERRAAGRDGMYDDNG